MLGIAEVCVGTPDLLGYHHGVEVRSSIRKHPVKEAFATITPDGVLGDEQTDLRVHGGRDKAIYAYPMVHLRYWAQLVGTSTAPGTFGENFTLYGDETEQTVRVGDLHRSGDVLLRVTKPRRPCFKLAMHLGTGIPGDLMRRNGYTGWYYRVERPGTMRVGAELEVVESDPNTQTIAEVFALKMREDPTIPGMTD